MKYIVFPKSDLDEVPQEVLDELHLVPRVSVDGQSVIMKVVNYEKLFPPVMMINETEEPTDEESVNEVQYPYPTYEGESLDALLSDDAWNQKQDIEEDTVLDKPVIQDTTVINGVKDTVL